MRFTRFLHVSHACSVLPTALFLTSLILAQTSEQTDPANRNELQGALRQARDAVVRLAEEDDSSFDSSISDKVNQLVESLLYVDDQDDVRYLQEHLKKTYADEIRSVLEPSATPQDFAARVSKADRLKDVFEHDKELQSIVTQEIRRGLIDDAANAAQKILVPGSRSAVFMDIAIAQHGKGNDSAATDAVSAAIQACFQPGTGLPLIIELPDRQLAQLAGGLADRGYPDGAQRAFAEAEKAVEDKAQPDSYDWSSLARTAIAVGDLSSAKRLLQKVEVKDQRVDLRIQIALAQARQEGSDSVVRTALKISDPWVKITALKGAADQQSEAGDSTGAITTLRIAIDAAHRTNQRPVLLLHDLAWAQIDAGDRTGAEETLELAMKENEKPAYGTDQVNGWVVLADTFAFLGQFDRAQKVALKTGDHYFRGLALGLIAQREVDAGLSEQAFAWAKKLKDPNERASAYLAITGAAIEKLKDGTKE